MQMTGEELRQRWLRYRRRFGSRRTILSDLKAGIVLGVESVPDGLASGLLAGVNPVMGLNAYIVGTFAGALATGSVFMSVQATGAMAVIIADVPEVHGDDGMGAMAMLTVMAGIVMLVLGVARLGSLVRFIPTAVLIGFVNAVAVNIVLSQLENFTGFDSDADARLLRVVDIAANLLQISWWSVIVGTVTIGLILLLERTPLGALSMVVAIIVGSALAVVLPDGAVATISDVAEAGRSLPSISLPDLSMIFVLIVPALSLALVGLVQGAAISGSIPNPDGRYPDASADFRGQGIARAFAERSEQGDDNGQDFDGMVHQECDAAPGRGERHSHDEVDDQCEPGDRDLDHEHEAYPVWKARHEHDHRVRDDEAEAEHREGNGRSGLPALQRLPRTLRLVSGGAGHVVGHRDHRRTRRESQGMRRTTRPSLVAGDGRAPRSPDTQRSQRVSSLPSRSRVRARRVSGTASRAPTGPMITVQNTTAKKLSVTLSPTASLTKAG